MSSSSGNPNAPQPPTGRNVNNKRPRSIQNSTSSSDYSHNEPRFIYVPEPKITCLNPVDVKDLLIELTSMPEALPSPLQLSPAMNAADVSLWLVFKILRLLFGAVELLRHLLGTVRFAVSSARPLSTPEMEPNWTLDDL